MRSIGKKCLNYVILAVAFFVWPVFASANLSITEIMYDLDGTDTGREWLEIYNNGEFVNLTNYKLFEADTNHSITANTGGETIGNNEYVILADNPEKFKTDNPGYAGKIFDSTFSLSNTGETLILKDKDLNVLDSVTYSSDMGAAGDGKTLQKVNNSWSVGIATPGIQNSAGDSSSGTNNNSNQDNNSNTQATTTEENANQTTVVVTKYVYSSHSSPVEISRFTSGSTFQVSAGRERLGFVGNAINFVAKNNLKNENQTVKYFWTFGDGTKEEGSSVSHIYEFPGEYSVVLNASYSGENAVSRTEIKVIEPSVALVFADQEKITLKNSSPNEINLNNWSLDNGHEKFVFPLDTIVGGNKNLTLARKVLKISGYFNEKIGLYDPTGRQISVLSTDKILGFKEIEPSPLALQKFDYNQATATGVTTENWLKIRDFVSLNREQLEKEALQLALRPGPTFAELSNQAQTNNYQSETNFLPKIELKDFASAGSETELASTTATSSEEVEGPGFFASLFGWPKRVYNLIATTFYGQ